MDYIPEELNAHSAYCSKAESLATFPIAYRMQTTVVVSKSVCMFEKVLLDHKSRLTENNIRKRENSLMYLFSRKSNSLNALSEANALVPI